ncbi:hypothetical protein ACER0C_005185 [Sarotherodon galilaeus]
MEFKLEDFTLSPTEEKLDRCKRDDLILIANFFDVTVPLNAKKKELKELLCVKLHERGLFGVEAGAVAGIPAPLKNLPPQTGPSGEELQLTLRIKEVEFKKYQLGVDAMHLKVGALEIERGAAVSASPPTIRSSPQSPSLQSPSPEPPSPNSEDSFDVSRDIKLVPAFRESEVDSYFSTVWSLLLQSKLVGKAQEVCTALSLEDSLDYEMVKAAVLRAYELVPEAYRQKFRGLRKTATQTDVKTLDDLCELVLLEEFKSQLPEKVVTYLNEQKFTTLSAAAVQADEFALTHKGVFSSPVHNTPHSVSPKIRSPKNIRRITTGATENGECYYCHEQGHLIAACPVLKRKKQSRKHIMSGHLGITKTYNRVLCYFFWPGLRSDAVNFCRSCHTCQLTGKPN